MSKQLDNIFLDVRNAFRLLSVYQARVLDTVNYVKEQTSLPGIWGRKWFSNPVRTCKNSFDPEYATLKIENGMWAWDFLYGYLFEYYMGGIKSGHRNVYFSIIQVSDDGYFKANPQESDQIDIDTFASVEDSHTLLVFVAGNSFWMQSEMGDDKDYGIFLTKFLTEGKEQFTLSSGKKEFFVIKKYDIQRFATQQRADEAISEFGKTVLELSGTKLFKEQFYR